MFTKLLSGHQAPVLAKVARRWPIFGPMLFMLLLPYGLTQLIRICIEWPLFHRQPYQTEFKSYLWGDRSAASWYDSRVLQAVFVVTFQVLGVLNWLNGSRTGSMEEWRKFAPSEIAHTLFFAVAGTTIVHALLSIIFGTRDAVWKKALLLCSLGPWVAGVIVDIRSGK